MAPELLAEQLVEAQIVRAVNLIGLTMDLSAVIQHGMSMELIALHLNLPTAGTAQDVSVLVMVVLMVVLMVVTAVMV